MLNLMWHRFEYFSSTKMLNVPLLTAVGINSPFSRSFPCPRSHFSECKILVFFIFADVDSVGYLLSTISTIQIDFFSDGKTLIFCRGEPSMAEQARSEKERQQIGVLLHSYSFTFSFIGWFFLNAMVQWWVSDIRKLSQNNLSMSTLTNAVNRARTMDMFFCSLTKAFSSLFSFKMKTFTGIFVNCVKHQVNEDMSSSVCI